MLMLGTVAVEHLNLAVVSSDGDGEPNNAVTGADEIEVVLCDSSLLGGTVEEELDLLEETGLLGRILLLAKSVGVGLDSLCERFSSYYKEVRPSECSYLAGRRCS